MVALIGIDLEFWSLAISIIAIVIAITKDFIIPYIFKPKLILEGANDDECPDDALSETLESKLIESQLKSRGMQPEHFPENIKSEVSKHKMKSRWLRLRLKNESGFFSRTAVNCYVKLIGIRNGKNQSVRPFNAFPLKWVLYDAPKNNLAKGEYHLLDIAFENETERVLYPAAQRPFGLPNNLVERKKEKLGPDVYTFNVGVYGDNFNPIFKDFKIELTHKFGELRFAE